MIKNFLKAFKDSDLCDRDFAKDFKEAYENDEDFNALFEIVSQWRQCNSDDANMEMALIILGCQNGEISPDLIYKTFMSVKPADADNSVLFGWYFAKVISLME